MLRFNMHFVQVLSILCLIILLLCGSLACTPKSTESVPPVQSPVEQRPPQVPPATPPMVTPAQTPVTEKPDVTFTLTSTAFTEGVKIPKRHACAAEDYSPPLMWKNAPSGTKSFAILMDDPDAYGWVHWVIFNLPPDISQLPENVKPAGKLENGAIQGKNSFGGMGYGGPCPPAPHHYNYTIYALDSILDLREGATKGAVNNAMNGHILGKATLMGIHP